MVSVNECLKLIFRYFRLMSALWKIGYNCILIRVDLFYQPSVRGARFYTVHIFPKVQSITIWYMDSFVLHVLSLFLWRWIELWLFSGQALVSLQYAVWTSCTMRQQLQPSGQRIGHTYASHSCYVSILGSSTHKQMGWGELFRNATNINIVFSSTIAAVTTDFVILSSS